MGRRWDKQRRAKEREREREEEKKNFKRSKKKHDGGRYRRQQHAIIVATAGCVKGPGRKSSADTSKRREAKKETVRVDPEAQTHWSRARGVLRGRGLRGGGRRSMQRKTNRSQQMKTIQTVKRHFFFFTVQAGLWRRSGGS